MNLKGVWRKFYSCDGVGEEVIKLLEMDEIIH